MLKYLLRVPVYLFCFRAGRRLLYVSFLVLLGLVLFHHLGPQRFRMSPIQTKIGNDLVEQAVERFPWDRDVGLVMMVSDSEAWAPFFTDALRARVTSYAADGGRKFDIAPDGFVDRFLRTLGFRTTRPALSDADIRRMCARMKTDTLLLVRSGGADYTEDATNATGRLSCQFYSKAGTVVRSVVVTSSHQKRARFLGSFRRVFERMNSVERTVWLVLGVVLFPFLASPLTLAILRHRSIRANALMVAGYSLAVFLAAWAVLPTPDDAFEGFLWCAGGIAVVWYVLAVCDFVAATSFKQGMKSA